MNGKQIGRYFINEEFDVLNIINENHPNGDGKYTSFGKENLPLWGACPSTFSSLSKANQKYILDNLEEFNIKSEVDAQLAKIWVFWFTKNNNLNQMEELFFIGLEARNNALLMQHIFNSLHEQMIEATTQAVMQDLKKL